MGTDVMTVLEHVLHDDIVDANDIARALGTTVRSVGRWQAGEVAPRRESEERLLELKAVVDLIHRHLRPVPARMWLRSPNPDLAYEKPIDLIAVGDYRKVIASILAMAEGVTA
jgi:uncharacterized protein (DUF2384 family)